MRATTIFTCLLLALGAPAAADGLTVGDPPECVTQDEVVQRILTDSPDAVVKAYSGDRADSISAGISRVVGEPIGQGKAFLVAKAPGSMTAYIVLFENGCAARHGRFPAALLDAWIGETVAQ